ncbi:hypothetical protein [Streptomyces longispororuber]|uniref:hypothetical protein n=1 Tax=Streptomyces longispororuber TaxID=68230 RepID=UPI0036FD2EBD
MSVRRGRLGVTALGVLAPALVWLVTDPLLGHRLRTAGGGRTLDIGAVPVAAVALLASLAGWAAGPPGWRPVPSEGASSPSELRSGVVPGGAQRPYPYGRSTRGVLRSTREC